MNKIKKGIYKHFKGNMYRVLDIVRNSETLEELVLYEALYDDPRGKLWVRPREMFFEKITQSGKIYSRFTFVSAE